MFLISTFPRFNERGEFTGVIHVARDITEKKRLERELEAKRAELERLSITDGLTELFNRRCFNEKIRQEMTRSKRMGHPLSLLFIDIDKFKNYNDLYGHREGDNVLKTLGDIIRKCIREDIDSGYRYGGEEFVVILPGIDKNGGVIVAERLREKFVETRFYPRGEKGEAQAVQKTLSVGVAGLQAGDDINSFVKRADGAMYKAKALGRNRAVSI